MGWVFLILVVGLAVLVLRGFDRMAGRGPKQITDGLNQSVLGRQDAARIPCPLCAEMIMPAAKKCPFCRSDL